MIAFLINTLHEGARGQKQAACIGVHNPVVFLVSDVLHRPRLRPDARVVDEDVEATERIQGLFAQALRGLAIADFMFDGDRLTINVFALFSAVAPAELGAEARDHATRRPTRGGIASPSLRAGSSGGQLPHQD